MNEAEQESVLRRLFAAPGEALAAEPFVQQLEQSLRRHRLRRLVRAASAASLDGLSTAVVHARRALIHAGRHVRGGLRAARVGGRSGN